jgi:hypothetical protein
MGADQERHETSASRLKDCGSALLFPSAIWWLGSSLDHGRSMTRMEHPAEAPAPEEVEDRLDTLADLDEWLRTPMLLLSAVWLALVVAELAWGASRLLETIGTVIWVIFLAEFALRLALAPDRSGSCGGTGSR